MTVTEIKQSVGSWAFRLRADTPREVLDRLQYFGHVAVVPGAVNVVEYGDNLLTAARYVGVLRAKSTGEEVLISGGGMAFWLGDENGNGAVFETAVDLVAQTFAASITALLPPSGSITAGTLYSVPGTYTGVHQYQTPRRAITYVTDTYGAEWRVNGNGTLDAGTVSQLYVTTPRAILVRKEDSQDLDLVALPGQTDLDLDVGDYTTRVVLLGEGEGDSIQIGTADAPSTPYNDIHGNDVVITRVVSESATVGVNVDTRAALVLAQYADVRPSVSLSTEAYDLKGDVQVGDSIYVYDPTAGFVDTNNEVQWGGEVIHPVKLRVVEMTWPMRTGWTFAYRDNLGVWTDLSPYVSYETGDTTLVVGELPAALSGISTEPIGTRPNPADTSIPAAPAFTGFSVGAYQSAETSTTKGAIRAEWSTPLNADGSTIVDGDHYEIRYRISEVLGYQVRWGVLNSTPYRWGALSGNRWGAPISAAVATSPQWLTAFVPWGTNAFTLLELTPGVIYELQIRAVDAQVPPHQGPYSASSFVTAIGDLFAPSTPAAPVVAGNTVSVQVTHYLGRASGGTYNLEPDLDHLEVHVGGSPDFYAEDATMVGKLAATTANMGSAPFPTVGTFTIRNVGQVYVKVKAVDRAGNKSGASAAAAVTAVLIDSAHISDLSASKITAGTLSANMILAAMLEIGTGGNIKMTEGALQVYNASGRPVVELGKRTLDAFGGYGMTVFGPDGLPKVRLGEINSPYESHGLEVQNVLGQLVSLSTLAFGIQVDQRHPGSASVTDPGLTGNWIDITGGLTPGAGPTVNVVVGNSGRCLVLWGAFMQQFADNFSYGGSVAFQVSGATSIAPNTPTGTYLRIGQSGNGLIDTSTTPDTSSNQHSFRVATMHMLTGLNPGLHTITLKYKVNASSPSSEVWFSNATLVAIPY